MFDFIEGMLAGTSFEHDGKNYVLIRTTSIRLKDGRSLAEAVEQGASTPAPVVVVPYGKIKKEDDAKEKEESD